MEQPWRRDVDWPPEFAGGIAHRLDISTSGALWVADSLQELDNMRTLFRTKNLDKRYLLLTSKSVPWDTNQIDRPIGHDRNRKRKMVVQRGSSTPVRGRWFRASTTFQRISGSLFEARITTGVTHQIRVHAAFVGIPILGDRLYGGGHTPENAPQGVQFFLHHVGLTGPPGFQTDPIDPPVWAR